MIETPNLHKAMPVDPAPDNAGHWWSTCVHCDAEVHQVPGGSGPVWVHDDGHVLGYNPTPESELETVTRLLIDAVRAWGRNPSSPRHVLALSQMVSRYEEVVAHEVVA